MREKTLSRIHKYFFIIFMILFLCFVASGFLIKQANTVLLFYRLSFFSVVFLIILAILILISAIIEKKQRKQSNYRFFAYSLLRFAISFFLFAMEMILKMFSFGELFS